jgi:site-specific recombinase XerD
MTISDPLIHITGESSLQPVIESWGMYLQDQGKSPHTVKAFLADLRLFAGFISPNNTIAAVTTNDINSFLGWLESGRGVACSPKSLSRRVTSIKAFFRWLFQNGRIPSDPAEKVLQKTVISPLPEVLTSEEIEKVRFVADASRRGKIPDSRPATLFGLLIETGMKKGECLALSLNHIDTTDSEQPFVFIRYANPSNRYKERKIELSQDWVEIFKEYRSQYQPNEKVFPWSPRRLEYLLEDLGQEAGLAKHLSYDMCRWSCALTDWRNEVESDKIRQKLGISKIQWREIGLKLRQLAEKQTGS